MDIFSIDFVDHYYEIQRRMGLSPAWWSAQKHSSTAMMSLFLNFGPEFDRTDCGTKTSTV
jgi:hypothetical protein